MAYYIPALSPVLSTLGDSHELVEHGLFSEVETLRAPLGYLASLLAGGNREVVAAVLAKLIALRSFQRARNLGQPADDGILRKAGLTEAAAARLYRLFTIAGYDERNVIPAQQREEQDPYTRKGASGFGILSKAGRGK
jgi:nitrate reductase beta subunit